MAVITVTSANFADEVENSNVPVLVDFWASWCGPCRMMSPVVDELAEGANGFKVGKVNVDDEGELARKFNVMSIPTLIVFSGGKPAAKAVGVRPKAAVLELIEEAKKAAV